MTAKSELSVQVVDDEIIVTLPGSHYFVTYYKPTKSPKLLAKFISDRDDPHVAVKLSEFLALAWKLANDEITSCGGLLGLGLWLGSWRAFWLGSWRATPKEHLHLRLCNLPVLVGIDPLENFCMGRLEFLERQSPIAISIH